MIRQTRFHRGSDAQTRMNTAEIVIGEVQCDSGFQVRELLAEGIRQPRKAPKLHSHGEVLPFYKASRDVLGVGLAKSNLGYNLRDAWWGVPPFGAVELAVIPKQFHKLGEVHVQAKRFGDADPVMVESIGGELY